MTETLDSTGTDRVELTITRVLDAPREKVFKAYVTPEQLARFWSPAGMSIPLSTINLDPRPGGAFEAVMVGDSDGTEYPMKAQYVEVSEPERIVFTVPGNGLLSSLTFTDLGGRTEVVVHQSNVPPANRDDTVDGFNSSLDRLTALLTESPTSP